MQAIRIIDEAEVDLPITGELDFIDTSNGLYRIDTSNPQNRQVYREMAKQQRDELDKIFAASGIGCVDIHSNETAIERYVPIP